MIALGETPSVARSDAHVLRVSCRRITGTSAARERRSNDASFSRFDRRATTHVSPTDVRRF
jgi:hypothetical protein